MVLSLAHGRAAAAALAGRAASLPTAAGLALSQLGGEVEEPRDELLLARPGG